MEIPSGQIAILGGGPAGLMAAEVLANAGRSVHVYESMPSLGRKFLMAGRGGLNLTHSEPFEEFLGRYGSRRAQLEPYLRQFGPEQLRLWAHELGIETFVGSSNRVFPVQMKSSPLLRAWLHRLEASGVTFHLRHTWLGWDGDGALRFQTPDGEKTLRPRALILALGGGSWSRLGSTGAWVDWLRARGVRVNDLKPSNCGFDVVWSGHFKNRFQGQPLKSVVLSFNSFRQRGEFIITRHGVEGSLIYAASSLLREALESGGPATVHLDLMPEQTSEQLAAKLSRPRGSRSFSTHLQKTLGLRGVKAGLLHEFLSKQILEDPARLAVAIKSLRVPLIAPRPIEEAISSAGGVSFDELNEDLMLRSVPGVFCAGEMLDWEAPTGGYLLTACFSTGRAAGQGVIKWLEKQA